MSTSQASNSQGNELNIGNAVSIAPTDISTLRSFSCGICFEMYTKEQRYPISLNCGHTFCLVCIRKLSRKEISIMCSICRKHTFSNYKRLGKNFVLLDILERSGLLEADEKQEKKEKNRFPVCGTSTSTGFAGFGNQANDDEDDDGDDSLLTALSIGRGGASNEYSNSFWVSNIELEDFYDMLESVRDYGLTGNVSALPREREEQITQLRSEMSSVESSLRRLRRSFNEIYGRARQLVVNVREQSNSVPSNSSENAAIPPPPLSDNSNRLFRGWPNNFYDDGDILYGLNTTAFTASDDEDEDWSDARLTRNYMRRDFQDAGTLFCYLCGVHFRYSPAMAQQHVRGRRHRDLITANLGQDGIIFEDEEEENVFGENYHLGPFSMSSRSRNSLPFFLEVPNAGLSLHVGHVHNPGTQNASASRRALGRFGRGGASSSAATNSHRSTSNNTTDVPPSDSRESSTHTVRASTPPRSNFGRRFGSVQSPTHPSNSTTTAANNRHVFGARQRDVQDDWDSIRPATARDEPRNQSTNDRSARTSIPSRNQGVTSVSNGGDLRPFGRPFHQRSNTDTSAPINNTPNESWSDHPADSDWVDRNSATTNANGRRGFRFRGTGNNQPTRFGAARPSASSTTGGRGFFSANARANGRHNSGGFGNFGGDSQDRRQFQSRNNSNGNNNNNRGDAFRPSFGRRGNRGGGGFTHGNNNNYPTNDDMAAWW